MNPLLDRWVNVEEIHEPSERSGKSIGIHAQSLKGPWPRLYEPDRKVSGKSRQ